MARAQRFLNRVRSLMQRKPAAPESAVPSAPPPGTHIEVSGNVNMAVAFDPQQRLVEFSWTESALAIEKKRCVVPYWAIKEVMGEIARQEANAEKSMSAQLAAMAHDGRLRSMA